MGGVGSTLALVVKRQEGTTSALSLAATAPIMVPNNCNVTCYNITKFTATRIQINQKTVFLPSCTSQDINIKKQHEISMRTKACKKMFFFVRFSDAVHSFSNILDKTEHSRTKLLGQCKKCLEKHKISQNSVKILLL